MRIKFRSILQQKKRKKNMVTMFSRINNLKLSQQILSISLAIPFLLAIGLTYFASNQVIDSENKPKDVLSSTTSQAVLEKVDRNFYERFGDVQAFAFNKLALQAVTLDSSDTDLQDFMNTMTSYYVLYDLMMVCDINGKVLAINTKNKNGQPVNSTFLIGTNVSSLDWFKICTSSDGPEGGAYYSDFSINKDVASIYGSEGWGMSFAAPIKDSKGKVQGVWYNYANWREVTMGIRREAEDVLRSKHAGSFILVTDKDGMVIDADSKTAILQKISLDSVIDESVPFELEGKLIYNDDYIIGVSEAKGAYTYKGKNWKAITCIPKSKLTFSTLFSGTLLNIMIFVIFSLIAATFFAINLSKKISSRINSIKDVIATLAKGELSEVTVSGKDEISEMESSVSALTQGLKLTSIFAKEIGEGNLGVNFQPLSERDVLGHSLLNMKDSLAKVAEEDRKRNWSNSGLAQIGDVLRNNSLVASEMYNNILVFIVKYLNANQGALFVLNKDNEHDPYLELVSCYAYDRKRFLEKRIEIGEGLVGQTVLEKETIYMTQIPDKYVTITSGIGEATAKSLLVVPLKNNEEVFGIIELAAFDEFQLYEIDFINKVAESIASIISSVRMNEKTNRLLEQSQQMTEELRAQEEEMRQNMEELQATQEEAERREQKLKQEIIKGVNL
jgi:GAF domain-containing protein